MTEEENDLVTEETDEKLVLTLLIKAKVKMGKAVKNVEFESDFVLPDDLEEIAVFRAHEFVEEEHKGWKLADVDWEVLEDGEEDEDEEESEDGEEDEEKMSKSK